jgi:hypothetical protein
MIYKIAIIILTTYFNLQSFAIPLSHLSIDERYQNFSKVKASIYNIEEINDNYTIQFTNFKSDKTFLVIPADSSTPNFVKDLFKT